MRVSATMKPALEYARLNQEKLHNTKVAFIEKDEDFDCYYTDISGRLQRINVKVEEFNLQHQLFESRKQVAELLVELDAELVAEETKANIEK